MTNRFVPGGTPKCGFTIMEVLIGLGITAVLGIMVLIVLRNFGWQNQTLLEGNAFQMQVGRLLDSMKRDLRSPEEVWIGGDWLKIRRFVGLSAEDTLREEVLWRLDGDLVMEERGKHALPHSFSAFTGKGRSLVFAVRSTPPRDLTLESASLVEISFRVDGPDPRFPRLLAASASVEVRAGSIHLEK